MISLVNILSLSVFGGIILHCIILNLNSIPKKQFEEKSQYNINATKILQIKQILLMFLGYYAVGKFVTAVLILLNKIIIPW